MLLISCTFLTLFHPGPHLLDPLMEVSPPGPVLVLDLQVSHHLLEQGLISGDNFLQQGHCVPMFVQAEDLVHGGPPEHAEGLQHV